MNNDIEFIKWLCAKAEGFTIDDGIIFINDLHNGTPVGHIWYYKVIYPLLLQRAIEGVNRTEEDIHIVQNHLYVEVIDWEYNVLDSWGSEVKDQAKESALKYIWESEKK
jgi:hypothetical protein